MEDQEWRNKTDESISALNQLTSTLQESLKDVKARAVNAETTGEKTLHEVIKVQTILTGLSDKYSEKVVTVSLEKEMGQLKDSIKQIGVDFLELKTTVGDIKNTMYELKANQKLNDPANRNKVVSEKLYIPILLGTFLMSIVAMVTSVWSAFIK